MLYLEGMEVTEAATLLRAELVVRRLAMLPSHAAVVVMDDAERVQKAEALLEDRGVLRHAAEPHGPVELDSRVLAPTAVRTFYLEALAAKDGELLLRALYSLAEVRTSEKKSAVEARAVPEILDAAEALFRELGALAGTAETEL